ncbi:hypothetical protein SAY87_031461 [Trapa incisa]|uniref:Uncharacterized protein n=1 Tax=Trapa incisa TaxID=236973 RepID=A0AAN7QL68_9MYRT|nr:hypothetical protein SAY87_031461 [Trapa incisa]
MGWTVGRHDLAHLLSLALEARYGSGAALSTEHSILAFRFSRLSLPRSSIRIVLSSPCLATGVAFCSRSAEGRFQPRGVRH